MFQLEQALHDWRLAAESHGTADAVLAELEDHLREEFAALTAAGQMPEEAWRLATSKLGHAAALGEEFNKLDRLQTLDRFVLGAIALVSVVTLAGVAIGILRAGRPRDPVLSIHVATITIGYLLGVFAASLAGYAAIRRFASRGPTAALAAVSIRVLKVLSLLAVGFTLTGFALGAVWSNQRWGRAFAGDLREIGAVLVALSFVAVAATSWGAVHASRWPLALSILGGGVIFAAWVGAFAQAAGYPLLLTTIGFGGLALSLALAGLSLRNRNTVSAS